MPAPETPLASIGLDVGGTKVFGAAVGWAGEIICTRKTTLARSLSIIEVMTDLASHLASEAYRKLHIPTSPVQCIGLGIPGTLDTEGNLTFSANLKQMVGVDARTELRASLAKKSTSENPALFGSDIPISVENDANCALIAEALVGAAHGCKDVMLLTLGTGIGGALMLGGKLLHGAHGYAGEFGHMVIMPGGFQCKCGRKGCLEHYVSGTANRRVSPEDMAGWMALGLANLILAFDPEIIVVGGGFGTGMGEKLLKPVRELLPELLREYSEAQIPRLAVARLGEGAGAVGAAINAIQHIAPRWDY
ncbi:MAG: ROK family protein [Acidimicrobiales bacterium]